MYKSLLLFIFLGTLFTVASQNTGSCIPFNNGSSYPSVDIHSLPYTVGNGQVIRIQNMNGNGTLTNKGTLRKSNLNSNITEFINYGTLYLTGTIETKVYNYGTIIVNGNMNIQNKGFIVNEVNSVFCVSGSIIINSQSGIYNHGLFEVDQNIHLNSGSYFSNNENGVVNIHSVSVDGNSIFCSSGGDLNVNTSVTVTNGGTFSFCEGDLTYGTVINTNNNGTFIVSPFCSANCISPLGLVITDFTVNNSPAGNNIRWKTDHERNAEEFSVEHSGDGISWKSVYGTTAKKQLLNTYEYTHTDFSAGDNYYRLVQTGSSAAKNSGIIHIRNAKKEIEERLNMLGQPVGDQYRGIVIIRYSDNTIEKVYQ